MATPPIPLPRVAHLSTVHARHDTRIFHKMCCSLASHGYDTHLIVADGKGNETQQNIHIHDVGQPASRLHRIVFSTFKILFRALSLRARIYHIHDPELMPCAILLRICGKRVIYDIHEHYRDILLDAYWLPSIIRSFGSYAYSAAEFITARIVNCSIVTTAYMQQTTHVARSIIIENFVKLSEFTPTDNAKENAVCCISILHHSRGVIEMVDAAGLSQTTLYLAGNYYSNSLREEAMQRAGWKYVHELGFIDRKAMQNIFERAQAGLIIVTPRLSYNHGSYNKIYEYMAAGIPVIASDLPFARAVIEKHGCGLLVSPATCTENIAKAIRWVIDHPDEAKAMGQRGRNAVEQDYNWESEASKLFALYASLLK